MNKDFYDVIVALYNFTNVQEVEVCILFKTKQSKGYTVYLQAIRFPGGYFGVKRIGMTVGNPRKLP